MKILIVLLACIAVSCLHFCYDIFYFIIDLALAYNCGQYFCRPQTHFAPTPTPTTTGGSSVFNPHHRPSASTSISTEPGVPTSSTLPSSSTTQETTAVKMDGKVQNSYAFRLKYKKVTSWKLIIKSQIVTG